MRRPRDVPPATNFEVSTCGDPRCGAHFILYDEHHDPMVELVLPRQDLPGLIKALQDLAYRKAVENEPMIIDIKNPWAGSGRAGNGSDI